MITLHKTNFFISWVQVKNKKVLFEISQFIWFFNLSAPPVARVQGGRRCGRPSPPAIVSLHWWVTLDTLYTLNIINPWLPSKTPPTMGQIGISDQINLKIHKNLFVNKFFLYNKKIPRTLRVLKNILSPNHYFLCVGIISKQKTFWHLSSLHLAIL